MEPAIMSGDHVVVNKFVPGPRITMNFFSLGKGEKPVFLRVAGWKVNRNDVLIFNYPYPGGEQLDLDPDLYYAKRCVAIPGDTFYVDNGFYRVKGLPDTLGYRRNQRILSERADHEFSPGVYHCYPHDSRYGWNVKSFGPLYVPKRGATVSVDSLSIALYGKLIAYETEKPVSVKNGTVTLGDSAIGAYTFDRNYYFMAGDYVLDSRDSRYWGLLPEDHITGKVAFVWNNRNRSTGKVRWNRFLKKMKPDNR
jgi:signal peptidase I